MSRVFTYTDTNVDLLCDALSSNRIIPEEKDNDYDDSTASIDDNHTSPAQGAMPLILPTQHTYVTIAPIVLSSLFHKWMHVTDKSTPSSLMIYHSTHIPHVSKLTQEESAVLSILTDHFWDNESNDELSIMIPPNETIHPIFRQSNGKIIVECSNHPVLRRIQEQTQSPLAVQNTYSNGIHCTGYGHLEDAYRNQPVLILKSDEPTKYGIEPTLIDICTDTKTIHVVRTGRITPSQILGALNNTDYADYQVLVQYERASQFIKTVRPRWNKRIYRVNWVSLDVFPQRPDEKAYNELVHNTHAYLDKCIFVDYGGLHPEFATVCWGYVDLSRFKDVKEAIHTFYDVMHQLSQMDSSHPILIYDVYADSGESNDIDEYLLILQERIRAIETSPTHEAMCIPYECICSILGRDTIHVPHEITPEERANNMEMVD